MPRVFKRIISFEIEGEIYDTETRPEDIIRNYSWHLKNYNDGYDDKSFIVFEHKDNRGRITNLKNNPKISKCKKPDTEYFVI